MKEKAPTAIEQAINAELATCEDDSYCQMSKACGIIIRNYLSSDDKHGDELIDKFVEGKKTLKEIGTELGAHQELLDALSKKINLDAHFSKSNELEEKPEQHGQDEV